MVRSQDKTTCFGGKETALYDERKAGRFSISEKPFYLGLHGEDGGDK
jgi:hypothetical protein